MPWLDKVVYHTVAKVPWIYSLMAAVNEQATRIRFGRIIRRVSAQSTISGLIDQRPALIRPIGPADLDEFHAMMTSIPEEHLRYFRPHKFDLDTLKRVLMSRAIITYGLFIENKMSAYCLLKLFATRRAYLGRVILPELSGRGIGRFLNKFLYWQVYQLGFQVYGTMHKDNLASAKSHIAVRPFTILSELPPGLHGPGFRLIHFHVLESDGVKPVMNLALREERKPPQNSDNAAESAANE